jgi:hypothetical protein
MFRRSFGSMLSDDRLSATVRDFSAATRQLNLGKGLKTNERDSGI